MKRLFEANASSTPPSFPPGLEEGYPKDGESGTIPGAWWHYMVTEEIVRAIIAGGLTPAGNNVGQLGQVIQTFKSLLDGHDSLIAALQANTLPYGTIIPWAGTVAPNGFIKAAGQVLPRSGVGSYPKLTDAVLTGGKLSAVVDSAWTSGRKGCFSLGNGVSTIRVPDLRAEFLRGLDDSAGIDASRVVGSPQADSSAYHQHYTVGFGGGRVDLNGTNYLRSGVAVAEGGLPNNNANFEYVLQGTAAVPAGGLTSSSGQSNETRPRNVALLFCIKAYD